MSMFQGIKDITICSNKYRCIHDGGDVWRIWRESAEAYIFIGSTRVYGKKRAKFVEAIERLEDMRGVL